MTVARRPNRPERFGADPILGYFRSELEARHDLYLRRRGELTAGGARTLRDFASAHLEYGLFRTPDGWLYREYAPHAERITLFGDFSDWRKLRMFTAHRRPDGVHELLLPAATLRHGMLYRLWIEWPGGAGDRLPLFARRVVQDPGTKIFSAQVWEPENAYVFRNAPVPRPESALIYEAHVGMAQEEPAVGSFTAFREKTLPRIRRAGYNTVELMAVMEHPYYGSFGYHVANFFAVSSRFGTPEEFKALVDEAHGMGLRVIIDLVHSHAVRNELEGPGNFDGSPGFFHEGPRRFHAAWDSLCFDYGRRETLRFLLSNCRFLLEEYRLDGFRFDGVTSMLYTHHGLGRCFTSYDDYYSGECDRDAVVYLTLANELIHTLRPDALTVAEDVSGMPGLAAPVGEGGMGFDLRLAMGVTDLWFKLFDLPDEAWSMSRLFHELVNRRRDECSISYVECHDQAIVGGKSAIFTLADSAMYDAMHRNSGSLAVDRAVALVKMAKLATAATADRGYLNFMGNEFGHPEWIDFPREGNGWSCAKARRQWSLCDNPELRYGELAACDRAMTGLLNTPGFYDACVQVVKIDEAAQVMIFERAGYWFCFNFSPTRSYPDYAFEVPAGSYTMVLDSDAAEFGGWGRREPALCWKPQTRPQGMFLQLYLPCRTATVLLRK